MLDRPSATAFKTPVRVQDIQETHGKGIQHPITRVCCTGMLMMHGNYKYRLRIVGRQKAVRQSHLSPQSCETLRQDNDFSCPLLNGRSRPMRYTNCCSFIWSHLPHSWPITRETHPINDRGLICLFNEASGHGKTCCRSNRRPRSWHLIRVYEVYRHTQVYARLLWLH